MLVGPYANGKTMIAERFAVTHLKACESRRVWVVQTREGAGLAHFYASILRTISSIMFARISTAASRTGSPISGRRVGSDITAPSRRSSG